MSSEWIFPEKLPCFNPEGTKFEKVFEDPIALICYAQYRRKHLVSDKENEWLPYFALEMSKEIRKIRRERIITLADAVKIWIHLWGSNPIFPYVASHSEPKTWEPILEAILPYLNGEKQLSLIQESGRWFLITETSKDLATKEDPAAYLQCGDRADMMKRTTMKGDICRDARRALMVGWISKGTKEMKLLMDHLLECRECLEWAKDKGFSELIQKRAEEKMKGLHCPICLEPMKVNISFKMAKCLGCDFILDWSSHEGMVMSIFRLTEILARKRGIKIGNMSILH
jgi:hypothetical protein